MFWKDRNPAQCLNCQKTEAEIFNEMIVEHMKNLNNN